MLRAKLILSWWIIFAYKMLHLLVSGYFCILIFRVWLICFFDAYRYGFSWLARNTTRGSKALPWWCFNYCHFTWRKDMEIMCVSNSRYQKHDEENRMVIHFLIFFSSLDHLKKHDNEAHTLKETWLNVSWVIRLCKGVKILPNVYYYKSVV